MSLQAAAQHLSSRGRGPDDMLIHMSKGEVKSLNDLAMAHGGHLTINPDTGLPEAGFLKKLLPAIIGAGLTVATGGAAAPWMIGLGLGGVETLRTGDIKKGLMAGLGAYGGAGIGAGLSSAGNAAISEAASAANPSFVGPMPGAASGLEAAKAGVSNLATEAGRSAALGAMGGGYGALSKAAMALGPALTQTEAPAPETPVDSTPASPLRYDYNPTTPMPAPDVPGYGQLGQDFGRQQRYFPTAGYRASTKEERGFAMGGPIEQMSNVNAVGANTGYPMADITKGAYATPYQAPVSSNMLAGSADTGVNPLTGEMSNFASGGLSDLGGYSDGGRLLRGPGDGVSDSIPAMIGKKQPARLADGEFVVPARIVSELGNGSTEAGARKLYAMMDRIQKARGKTVGKGKVAKNSHSEKYLPA
jgi:hypothetical protein